MNNISNRLNSIIDMVDNNLIVCDLCSDHAYIPISLIKNNKAKKVIATDINTNSINRIKFNIKNYLNNEEIKFIDIRQGDGLSILSYNDFDILIISGIGYDLMIRIIKNINLYNFKYLLLSPQTKFYDFRKYICNNNLLITNEKIIYEDNQYYFIFKIVKNLNNIIEKYTDTELLYSKHLLYKKNELLLNYMKLKLFEYNKIITTLPKNNTKYDKILYFINLTKNAINNMENL